MSDFIDLCSEEEDVKREERSSCVSRELHDEENRRQNSQIHEYHSQESANMKDSIYFQMKRSRIADSCTPIDLTYSGKKPVSCANANINLSIISIHSTQSEKKRMAANTLSFHSQESPKARDMSLIDIVDSPLNNLMYTFPSSPVQSPENNFHAHQNEISHIGKEREEEEVRSEAEIARYSGARQESSCSSAANKTNSVFSMLSSRVISQQLSQHSDMHNSNIQTLSNAAVQSLTLTPIQSKVKKNVGKRLVTASQVTSATISVDPLHSISSQPSIFSARNSNEESAVPAEVEEEEDVVMLTVLPEQRSDYEVRLLIDRRERANNLVLASLQALGVRCEAANLAVGDFLFVARRKTHGLYATIESDAVASDTLVVDQVVIERKAVADLAASLLDGRFADQKRRLKMTKIQRCVVLVEGETLSLPPQMQRILTAQHLKTAMVNAFADHAMHVVRTRNMDHSIAFLRTLYKQVSHSFFSSSAVSSSSLSSTTAASITIAAANASGSDTTWDNATPSDTKQFMSFKQYQERYRARSADNLSELFGQQLRQIHGCGASTAHAIVCRYGTLAHFVWHLRSIGRINALVSDTRRDFHIS